MLQGSDQNTSVHVGDVARERPDYPDMWAMFCLVIASAIALLQDLALMTPDRAKSCRMFAGAVDILEGLALMTPDRAKSCKMFTGAVDLLEDLASPARVG